MNIGHRRKHKGIKGNKRNCKKRKMDYIKWKTKISKEAN